MEKMEHPSQPPFGASPPYPYPQPPPPPLQPNIVMTGVAFGPESQHLICPHCNASISSRVEKEANFKTHMVAAILCLLGCWCCAPCPYCTDNCLAKKHYCPACTAYLGSYEN